MSLRVLVFQRLLLRLVAPCNKKGLAIISQPCGRQQSYRGSQQPSCCPWGLLRSPKNSGSAQTFKRVKQKCLHFYFRATCLELALCPRKRGRCSRLASLSGESLRGSREICLLWAFPALSCGSGYILWVARFTPFPPNLIKRSHAPENIRTKLSASLRPKGSLSLTRRRRGCIFHINVNYSFFMFTYSTICFRDLPI